MAHKTEPWAGTRARHRTVADRPPARVPWRTLVPAIAEAFGTFGLTYVAVMVLTADAAPIAVALAQGLTIAVLVSATATVASTTFNPAITVTLWATRRLSGAQCVSNVAGQFAGALLGGLLARASVGGNGDHDITAGIPALRPGVGFGQGLLVETLLTFLLVSVVLGTAADYRSSARLGGIAMGGAVALDVLAGGPITGAAMNPARWVGPALAQGAFPNGWVYLLAPAGGALIAGLLWNHLFLARRRS
jgi:glycerol uptake facilitator-like aquaporin